jgi:tetratricopeptide (TPR) repeat protein
LNHLDEFKSKKIARRHAFFLKGFSHRFKKNFDAAEKEFLQAHGLAPKNFSINRELANLYRHQADFVEGEGYARAAYDVAPTNPYVLDVLLECLLGKSYLEMEVDQTELDKLFGELAKYGDVPGSSFYQARIAQDLYRKKQMPAALAAANRAIQRTPEFLPCYFLRADVYLGQRNTAAAREDLRTINKLLEKHGGFSEDEERRTEELEIRILVEERQFRTAREKLEKSYFISRRATGRLRQLLVHAINRDPSKADFASREWARTYKER